MGGPSHGMGPSAGCMGQSLGPSLRRLANSEVSDEQLSAEHEYMRLLERMRSAHHPQPSNPLARRLDEVRADAKAEAGKQCEAGKGELGKAEAKGDAKSDAQGEAKSEVKGEANKGEGKGETKGDEHT